MRVLSLIILYVILLINSSPLIILFGSADLVSKSFQVKLFCLMLDSVNAFPKHLKLTNTHPNFLSGTATRFLACLAGRSALVYN